MLLAAQMRSVHSCQPPLMLLLVCWLPKQDIAQGFTQDSMYLTLGENNCLLCDRMNVSAWCTLA